MSSTVLHATKIPLPHPGDGLRVARAQRSRLADEVGRLTDQEWRTGTECEPWTVFDVVAHVTESVRYTRRPLLYLVDSVVARVRYPRRATLDAVNERAIARWRSTSAEDLLAELRRRTTTVTDPPAWLRRMPVRDAGLPPGATIGYFVDAILTRDVWLHRHDIARAVGHLPDPEPTDTEVVAQVVRDLGLLWTGPGVVLRLTGAAGGAWILGEDDDPAPVSVDAVELMRHLSGRQVPGEPFSGVPEPLHGTLVDARVVF